MQRIAAAGIGTLMATSGTAAVVLSAPPFLMATGIVVAAAGALVIYRSIRLSEASEKFSLTFNFPT
jgi:hypothetical protein